MSTKTAYLSKYNGYLKLKNYSQRTIESYSKFVNDFLEYCSRDKGRGGAFEDFASSYFLALQSKGYSWSTINGYYSAIKLLCAKVLRQDWSLAYLPRPKTPRVLPRILSREEIVRLIESPKSLKHRIIITFMYAAGLRISEVLHLKLSDIDSDRLEVYVQQGKGHKDRLVTIPVKLLDLLRVCYKRYRPKEYLFEGLGDTRHYSASSIRKILVRTRIGAKIDKRVSPHTLRHCYREAKE